MVVQDLTCSWFLFPEIGLGADFSMVCWFDFFKKQFFCPVVFVALYPICFGIDMQASWSTLGASVPSWGIVRSGIGSSHVW